MAEPYTFEHDGVAVAYFPATVRTSLEARRIQHKLLDAYGHLEPNAGPVPRDEWDNISEYATGMSQCKSTAAWWISSNASSAQARQAFECFMDQDPDLFDKFVEANRATLPPKKTRLITSET